MRALRGEVTGEANRRCGQRVRPARRCSPDTRAITENAMKSIAKRKEDAIEKLMPERSPSLDEMLDEALDETFPASDPVALTAPRRPSGRGQEPRNARLEGETEAGPP